MRGEAAVLDGPDHGRLAATILSLAPEAGRDRAIEVIVHFRLECLVESGTKATGGGNTRAAMPRTVIALRLQGR